MDKQDCEWPNKGVQWWIHVVDANVDSSFTGDTKILILFLIVWSLLTKTSIL